jgi:hypothetical protein
MSSSQQLSLHPCGYVIVRLFHLFAIQTQNQHLLSPILHFRRKGTAFF